LAEGDGKDPRADGGKRDRETAPAHRAIRIRERRREILPVLPVLAADQESGAKAGASRTARG
jgi:hypothetical protein